MDIKQSELQENATADTKNTTDGKGSIDSRVKNSIVYNPKSASLEKQIRLYLVPLLALSIFFGVLFFATIPAIKAVFKTRDEKAGVEQDLNSKKVELKELEELRASNELNSDLLDRLDIIIPTSKTEVINYRKKIQEIAFDNLVEQQDVKIGERIIVDSGSRNEEEESLKLELELVQIPTQFSLVGPLQNFQEMLNAIYNDTDFIIISQMELTNNRDGGDSSMDIILSKYQYNPLETEEQERKILDSVSYKQDPDEEVVEFIRKKTNLIDQVSSNDESDSDGFLEESGSF